MSIWLHPNWKGSSSSFFFGALLTCLCLLLFFLFFSPWGRASLRWCQFAVIISIRSQLKQLANPPSHASSAARIICVCFLTRRRDCANLLWGETGERGREREKGGEGERRVYTATKTTERVRMRNRERRTKSKDGLKNVFVPNAAFVFRPTPSCEWCRFRRKWKYDEVKKRRWSEHRHDHWSSTWGAWPYGWVLVNRLWLQVTFYTPSNQDQSEHDVVIKKNTFPVTVSTSVCSNAVVNKLWLPLVDLSAAETIFHTF